MLHSRYVKFGNDTGSVEMLAGQALSDGVGPHPLFRGVRRVEIAGVGPLKVERVEGGVRVGGSSITVGFDGASATVDAQTVVIHTR